MLKFDFKHAFGFPKIMPDFKIIRYNSVDKHLSW